MARKRMIDPSIWSDEKLGLLSPLHRLLFIGLFSNADDEGRLPGHPNYVKSLIFPYDNDITPQNVEAMLNDLNSKGFILTYMVNGQRYIQVVNFLKYQKINRPTPSKIPPPPVELITRNTTSCFNESSVNTHEIVTESSMSTHEELNEDSLNTHKQLTEDSVNTHEQFTAQIEKEKEEEKENKNNKDVVTNVTTSRTGSDEPACVAEECKISTSTQEKKLEGEQGMAVTSEPEQVTETAVQLDTNNNALNTTGVELENSKECNTIPQGQGTARTHDHLTVLREEDEIELLEGFFKDSSDQCTTIDTATCDSAPFAKMKGTATVCMTVAESMDSKVVELDDFVCVVFENFKQELETSPASEPVTQDKLKEISQILQQNKIECGKRDVPATNDDDFQEEEKEIQELTNQKLIARLVGKYRRATGMKSKDDFPRIGHLYLEFSYAIVEQAIGVIEKRIKQQNVKIKDPVAYLYKVCEGIEKKMEERHEKYKKKESKGRHYSLINFSPEVLKIVEGGYQNDL